MNSEEFFKAANTMVQIQTDEQSAYAQKVKQAEKFAEGTQGAAWNGMYLMGLAIAGLELLPVDILVTIKFYCVKAPQPHPDDPFAWEPSYIIETNAFNK